MKFDTVEPFTGLLDISDGFYAIQTHIDGVRRTHPRCSYYLVPHGDLGGRWVFRRLPSLLRIANWWHDKLNFWLFCKMLGTFVWWWRIIIWFNSIMQTSTVWLTNALSIFVEARYIAVWVVVFYGVGDNIVCHCASDNTLVTNALSPRCGV